MLGSQPHSVHAAAWPQNRWSLVHHACSAAIMPCLNDMSKHGVCNLQGNQKVPRHASLDVIHASVGTRLPPIIFIHAAKRHDVSISCNAFAGLAYR